MHHKSLREQIIETSGNFLFREGFQQNEFLPIGIVNFMDLLADYYEEGQELFPEVVITSDLEKLLEPFPFSHKLPIGHGDLTEVQFRKIVKLCAPLSRNGWIIFVEIKQDNLQFGVLTAEITELSPTFYQQVIGDLSQDFSELPIAYIKNIGHKRVLLAGTKVKIITSLNLREVEEQIEGNVTQLCEGIISDVDTGDQTVFSTYLGKIVNESLRLGHGNLIGVVKEQKIMELKNSQSDAIYLDSPIDLLNFTTTLEANQTAAASKSVMLYSTLIQSMLNYDGITVFTTTGKIIAYNLFISDEIEFSGMGGARARAYEMMKTCNLFSCCFYKSQDGREDFWKDRNE